jgi:hypothetical protein
LFASQGRLIGKVTTPTNIVVGFAKLKKCKSGSIGKSNT